MPKISIFKNISQVDNPVSCDLQQHLFDIRDGKWEDIVNTCRLIKDKKERDEYKKTMPTATLSGEFLKRDDSSLITHTGYIAIDIDNVENINQIKKTLSDDKYSYSVCVSVSGRGLRALFLIEQGMHREAFKGLRSYLFNSYSIVCDPNGINISKPYVVTYDPFIYIAFDGVPVFKKYVKEEIIKRDNIYVHTTTDFSSVLKTIKERGVNICEDYNDWLKLGFALTEQFGEDGRGFFHDLSSVSSKYNSKNTDKQFNYCLKAKGSKTASISTFYYLAQKNGIKVSSDQTKKIVRATKNGKKAGLSKQQVIENLKKFDGIEGADTFISEIFESPDQNEDFTEDSILYQLELFISNSYSLRMNEVTGYVEEKGVALTPEDLNSIFISAKKNVPNLDYQLLIRLLKSDFTEKYNPFFEFFGSDGIATELPAKPIENIGFESPLIDLLAKSIINKNPAYTSFFLRKWIVGIISAAHKVHSPLLLCLLGTQNTGKTEFFRRLLPKELNQYYAESKLDKEKDDELLMTENLLIMDDELGGKSKQDSQKLKNITSKQYFSLRRPYGDHNEKILRLAVLCGTSNFREILTDRTGNRRVIPAEVDMIDKDVYNSINKKDLFMEAYKLYREGFDWRVTQNDIPYLNQNEGDYEQLVKEAELILKYYQPGFTDSLSTTEIAVEIELLTRQKLNINAIGREMERIGFEKKTVRVNKNTTLKKWILDKINRVEVIYNKPFSLKDEDNEVIKDFDVPF